MWCKGYCVWLHFIDEGEKPSSYFCKLETHYNTNKSIPFIENEDGILITNQKEILKETCKFYKQLYAKNDKEINIDLKTDLKKVTVQPLTSNNLVRSKDY